MGMFSPSKNDSQELERHISPFVAWSFSIGTSIGWGSFVITSNDYLLKAGPLGSCLGMGISMLLMLIIARNYHYLMQRHPSAGGAYTYAKLAFGYDHGFLTAWFVGITYLAILWANATSVPLFARYFFGDAFKVGFSYVIFGYDVYLGEALLSIAAILIFGFLCIALKRIVARLMVGLAVAFSLGITVCFAAGMGGLQGNLAVFEPAFIPDNNVFMQIITIACISPWAFIGFENISHMSREFTFSQGSSFKVLAASVVATTVLYVFVIVLSTTAYPPQFDSWLDYVSHLDELHGVEALPAFYAASRFLGDAGVSLLFVALFCLIATSLVGNMTALSRLFYALAKDDILPRSLATLNDRGTPYRAFLAIMAISCIVPFLGRTAIGWIVDVTTIGATITYGFVSAAAYRTASMHADAHHKVMGMLGLVLMVVMGLILILPNLLASSTMAVESYFLFTVWAILGLLFFRHILRSDPDNRFGESVIVWIVLLAFVLFMSCVWMEQSAERASDVALSDMQSYYEEGTLSPGSSEEAGAYYAREHNLVHVVNTRNTLIILSIFALSLGVLISNYSFMRRREHENVLQLGLERIRANYDELTGARNKHAYNEFIEEIEFQLRNDPSYEFAVAVCDLNDLKSVNDSFGHLSGDVYIMDACKVISETFVHSSVFRVGGDEFAVILEGDDLHNREELVKGLRALSDENLEIGGVVISVGVAAFDRTLDKDTASTYDRADMLMYDHKRELKAKLAAVKAVRTQALSDHAAARGYTSPEDREMPHR